MVRTVREVMVRAVGSPQDNDCAVLPFLVIGNAVECRFLVTLIHREDIQEPVEHLCSRLCCAASDYEDTSRKTLIMVQLGILHSCNVVKYSVFRYLSGIPLLSSHCIHLTVNISLQRHMPLQSSLKMVMVRCRRPTLGAVVEECIFRKLGRQVEDVNESFPYRLVLVICGGDHKVFREYRIWIYQYIIFLSLTAFERKKDLICRTVLPAQEALPLLERRSVCLCGR